MLDLLDVTTRHSHGVVRIAVRGALDLATAPNLRSALDLALSSDARRIVLDLSELEFADSAGLGVLVEAHRRSEENGIALGITPPAGQPMQTLEIAGLADVLPLLRQRVRPPSGSRRLLLVI